MPVKFKDYYEILGVGRERPARRRSKKPFASWRANIIRMSPKTKRRLRKSSKRSTRLTRYWATLPNAKSMTNWARTGAPGLTFRPPPGWESFGGGNRTAGRGARGEDFEFQFGGTGFSDFFEQFFGSRGARSGGGFGRSGGFAEEEYASERGRDIEGDIMVTLDEAIRGSVRAVSVQRAVPCEHCGGTGRRAGHVCNVCGGSGRVPKTENYQVKIPAGVNEGQRCGSPAAGRPASAADRPGTCSCGYGWRDTRTSRWKITT